MSTTFKNEVAVLVGRKRFRYWSRIQITRAIDSIDTVEVEAPFEPDNQTFRRIFRPMSYQSLNVTVNDEPLLTGTMVPVTPRLTPEANDVAVGAYSLPGVLSESTPAVDALPLLFKGQNLHEIAATLIEPFGLQIEARVSPGDPFKKVRIEADQQILPALADLAKQRNQVISNNETGDLVFQTAIESGKPVATLKQGIPPLEGATPEFNPREYYSEITGLKAVRPRSKRTTQFTVVNDLIPNIYRPYIFRVDNTEDVDLEAAVLAKKARMFANAVAYTLEVATWRDASGNLWEPNTIVRVQAPGVMIYRPFDFVIRSVILDKDKEKESATLDVMVPGSFARTAEVGSLPWDE